MTLQAGEILQQGCFYRDNLRDAKARFDYISDGQMRQVCQHFTYYGFRYMLVEGIEQVDPGGFHRLGNPLRPGVHPSMPHLPPQAGPPHGQHSVGTEEQFC